jgi:hypothetical protein
VRIFEELLEWKSSGSGQENRINDRGIRCADHATPSNRKKLALTSPTSGGRSVGIVRLRTKGHGDGALTLAPEAGTKVGRAVVCTPLYHPTQDLHVVMLL